MRVVISANHLDCREKTKRRVIMEDPSQEGPDLFTTDGKTVIEARMLRRTLQESGQTLKVGIQTELNKMVGRLGGDLERSTSAQVGYAVLTYIDSTGIHAIVLEVLRS